MMSDFKPEHLEAARMALLGVEFSHPAILDLVERNIAEGFADLEATVEARVRRELEASDPFEALMRHYDEGQRVEVYVGEGGYRYVETPEFFAYADDTRRAALSVCKTLGLAPSTSLPETAGEKVDSNGKD
jgi:hypothetical protein